jgi:hypothetical protein
VSKRDASSVVNFMVLVRFRQESEIVRVDHSQTPKALLFDFSVLCDLRTAVKVSIWPDGNALRNGLFSTTRSTVFAKFCLRSDKIFDSPLLLSAHRIKLLLHAIFNVFIGS